MFQGLIEASVGEMIIFTLAVTHITIASVTIFLHRHQAHRALSIHPIVSHFFRFWLWLTTGIVTKEWVAIHRKHHAKCETEEDPHSPQTRGIKKVLLEGAELYRAESKNNETLDHYGHATPNDWIERNVYTRLRNIGIIIMLAIDVSLFGFAGLTIWAVQMLWIPFWAAGVINGIGHYWGYRNYECADASRNIFPIGILIGGEELHNNHHTYASSAKLSSKWWEIDIGWFYIKVLSFLRLATVKRVAPKPVINNSVVSVNTETVRAIIQNRFQVMATYSKEVIASVNKETLSKADKREKSLLKRAKPLLAREESLMDDYAKITLKAILEKYNELKTVYQFKTSLQELWRNNNKLSNEKMLHHLQDWCKQAEASGIQALENFSARLRSYSLQNA